MKKNEHFTNIEKKIIKVLGKGEGLSISEIAKQIGETRYITEKYIKKLKVKDWLIEDK